METENLTDVSEAIQPETHNEQVLLSDLSQADAEHVADDAPPVDEPQPDAVVTDSVDTAKAEAALALMGLEGAMKVFIHPRFAFDAAARDNAIEKFGPLLVKYGNLLPQWLVQYEEEINAGFAAVQLVSNSMGQIKQLKAEDAALLANQEAANDDTQESEAA
ncbi:hypothetical protein [Thaumasiovibrio sp. DFM-14]|uniref:hypothetical protein n=1 Tax=Thaumasiovibrio sp. DFM-14 TaxID=3384792 RepID=UPI0039A0DBF1